MEFELIAKTFMGLEPVLAQELTQLGANNVKIGRRMVSFSGDNELMYRANFQLHTAIRILKPIKHFKALSADDVYEEVQKIDWEQYLDVKKTFSVDSVVYSEEFRNSRFVTYKVKDAIVDWFREKHGIRPNISVSNPDMRLNIHIAEDACTLSLDSSGESGVSGSSLERSVGCRNDTHDGVESRHRLHRPLMRVGYIAYRSSPHRTEYEPGRLSERIRIREVAGLRS